jgi:hypothetical protein
MDAISEYIVPLGLRCRGAPPLKFRIGRERTQA